MKIMVRLDELFHVKNGIPAGSVDILAAAGKGRVPFLRPAKTQQRTILGWIEVSTIGSKNIHPAGSIVVSSNGAGSLCYSYVSSFEFAANADVCVLYPKKQNMSIEDRCFYARCISANRPLFSYARTPKGERLKSLNLPAHAALPPEVDAFNFEKLNGILDASYGIGCRTAFATDMCRLDDLFDITMGTDLDLMYLKKVSSGGVPYVARTAQKNGITAHVKQIEKVNPITGGCLTVALVGSILSTFVQTRDFYTSQNIAVLRPKIYMSIGEMFFYSTCIEVNKFRYSYGRNATRTISEIMVPSPTNLPDFIETICKKTTSDVQSLLVARPCHANL